LHSTTEWYFTAFRRAYARCQRFSLDRRIDSPQLQRIKLSFPAKKALSRSACGLLVSAKDYGREVSTMKKLAIAFALVLGLGVVNAIVSASNFSFAQEEPQPAPKPEKPDPD
jgi:hypothetical protein